MQYQAFDVHYGKCKVDSDGERVIKEARAEGETTTTKHAPPSLAPPRRPNHVPSICRDHLKGIKMDHMFQL